MAHDDGGPDYATDEDSDFTTGNVLDNDIDPDTMVLSVVGIDTTGTVGQILNNGDGTFDYDPFGGFEYLAVGEQAWDTFTYIVSDGSLTDTATVSITVSGINDGPMISDILDQTTDVGQPVGPISFTVGDVDTLVTGLTLQSASSNTTLVPTANIALGGIGENRTVTITPTAGIAGTTIITVSVSDGEFTNYDAFALRVIEYRIHMPLIVRNY